MKPRQRNLTPVIDHFSDDNIKVFALGGLGEVGKNMYVIESEDEIILIDSGIMFADSNYGVQYIIPDYTYLIKNNEKIKALFITHGHEDHIGGIPHLLRKVSIPVIYASGLAIDLIKNKISEFYNLTCNLQEFTSSSEFNFKNFTVTFFRTNHSIPDSFGIAIKTRLGYIVHTGDFKFDFTPLGYHTEYSKITELGDKGVLCLLSDSTNALVDKFSVSERKIGESIKSIFTNIKGRILISTFASNVYRVQQIIEASIACGRKVIVYGRSMEKTIKVALKNGYIKCPDSIFINSTDLSKIPNNKITIITTGSQGEPLAALSRIANGTHRQIKIQKGDTIIFSSSAIPGNQESINRTINKLYKSGANVIVNSPLTDTHTSGHAGETELQIMLSLLKPKYFMPIHGEYSMQKKHTELAIATGVSPANCFILENGKVLTFTDSKVFSLYSVQSGNVYIDDDLIEIESNVIRERKQMGDDGLVAIIYSVNKNRELIQTPNIISRGFIYAKNSNSLMKSIKTKGEQLYNEVMNDPAILPSYITSTIVSDLASFIVSKTERRPLIQVIYMQC